MALISITMGVYEAAFKSFGSEDDDESLSPENIAYAAAKSVFLWGTVYQRFNLLR